MKKNIFLLLIVSSNFLFAQVGIGTTSVSASALLQVDATNKGLLPPRVIGANKPATATESLLLYNTTNNKLEYNQGSSSDINWLPINATIGYSAVKYTNNDVATVYSSSTSSLTNIFGNLAFNTNTAIFEKVDNFQLKIKQSGWYQIEANIYYAVTTPSVRVVPLLTLQKNGSTEIGVVVGTYIRNSGTVHTKASLYYNDIVYLSSQDIIALKTKAAEATGVNYTFDTVNGSFVSITKLN